MEPIGTEENDVLYTSIGIETYLYEELPDLTWLAMVVELSEKRASIQES